jgi:hypothetical protein
MLAVDRADRPAGAQEVLGILRHIEATANLASLLANGENDTVEFKQTLRWDLKLAENNDELLRASIKTVGAFLNSFGGTLLIGVGDSGQPIGLDDDLSEWPQAGDGPFSDGAVPACWRSPDLSRGRKACPRTNLPSS